MDAPEIGDIALTERIGLHELTPRRASLEAAFMDLTHDSVQYRSAANGEAPPEELIETMHALAGERSE
jgi:ABC-2 type transport system ATP-binding protein